MTTFYVTFGLGTMCGKNYLTAYAPDEETLRVRLNADMASGWIPKWAGLYEDIEAVRLHGLVSLNVAYEAVTKHSSGPCKFR